MNSFTDNLMIENTDSKNSMFDHKHMFMSDLYANNQKKMFQLNHEDMYDIYQECY